MCVTRSRAGADGATRLHFNMLLNNGMIQGLPGNQKEGEKRGASATQNTTKGDFSAIGTPEWGRETGSFIFQLVNSTQKKKKGEGITELEGKGWANQNEGELKYPFGNEYRKGV